MHQLHNYKDEHVVALLKVLKSKIQVIPCKNEKMLHKLSKGFKWNALWSWMLVTLMSIFKNNNNFLHKDALYTLVHFIYWIAVRHTLNTYAKSYVVKVKTQIMWK